MLTNNRCRFESLENRLYLAVTASVSDGDLIVEGDADGAVEIVAVGEGTYRVTDNGVLIADESTLIGVTDDIHINLESSIEGTDDAVTVDLIGQTVDKVYAYLGDGDNSFELRGGTARDLVYRGGEGIDIISLSATIESLAVIWLGDGDNDLTVAGEVGNLSIHGGEGADFVTIADAAVISGAVTAKLGGGNNSLMLVGSVGGRLVVSARDGDDAVTIAETAVLGKSAKIALGDGDNAATIAGRIDGKLVYNGSDGNDSLVLAETAVIADSFFARLGDGENSVTHFGTVEGDFNVVSLHEADTVEISDSAVIGGETNLGLGQQRTGHGRCGRGREFGELHLNGRRLGFYFR